MPRTIRHLPQRTLMRRRRLMTGEFTETLLRSILPRTNRTALHTDRIAIISYRKRRSRCRLLSHCCSSKVQLLSDKTLNLILKLLGFLPQFPLQLTLACFRYVKYIYKLYTFSSFIPHIYFCLLIFCFAYLFT